VSAPATLATAFPDVPGLTLEPMTADHLDEAAQLEVDAGLKQPCTTAAHGLWDIELFGPQPPCTGPLSHVRAGLAGDLEAEDGWCLRLAFQGRTLQYSMTQLDLEHHMAENVLVLRATRERPAWFWREAERPVFAALATLGVTQVQVWIPPAGPGAGTVRRRAWLEAHFAASYIGQWRRGGARAWAMPVDLTRFTGWPARRTAPPWRRGALTIAACGLDQALALMPALWAGYSDTRAADATRVLRERALLDGGTIALGSEHGAPKALWVTRDHVAGGTAAWMTTLTPWAAAPRLLHKGIVEWQLALGYATSVSAWEAWMWNLPRARALVPWREVQRSIHHGAEWVTTALTLADAAAIPDAQWV
jgi:hypothetical protein